MALHVAYCIVLQQGAIAVLVVCICYLPSDLQVLPDTKGLVIAQGEPNTLIIATGSISGNLFMADSEGNTYVTAAGQAARQAPTKTQLGPT